MHQSVKDGVAQGGVPDDLVPLLDGELAGDQGGAQAVAVLQDFEDVTALLFGEVGQSPVIDDEQGRGGCRQRESSGSVRRPWPWRGRRRAGERADRGRG